MRQQPLAQAPLQAPLPQQPAQVEGEHHQRQGRAVHPGLEAMARAVEANGLLQLIAVALRQGPLRQAEALRRPRIHRQPRHGAAIGLALGDHPVGRLLLHHQLAGSAGVVIGKKQQLAADPLGQIGGSLGAGGSPDFDHPLAIQHHPGRRGRIGSCNRRNRRDQAAQQCQ